jgi:hypothetical protein
VRACLIARPPSLTRRLCVFSRLHSKPQTPNPDNASVRVLACAHPGAYLKLLQKEAVADLSKFDNTARYTIMFGALD